MTGKHSGVLTRVQAVAPDTTCEPHSGPAAGGRIPHPFSDVPAALPASEQESLTEVPTSGSMKIEFNQKAFARFLDRTAHRVPSTSQPSCKDFEALCHQVLM